MAVKDEDVSIGIRFHLRVVWFLKDARRGVCVCGCVCAGVSVWGCACVCVLQVQFEQQRKLIKSAS